MNRILFESKEIKNGIVEIDDVRAEHIRQVLHSEVGDILKTGEVDGLLGTSEVLSIGDKITLKVHHDTESAKPWFDLILAPPRPRVMKRLLPQLATLGVGNITLVGAEKVEKDFWGATLLKEENYRPLLIDGLMQAGTTILPKIESYKSFKRFMKTALPENDERLRIVAHPYDKKRGAEEWGEENARRIVFAIGPEGGWMDVEVELLEAAHFIRYSLGSRILRTDTATIALIAQFMKGR